MSRDTDAVDVPDDNVIGQDAGEFLFTEAPQDATFHAASSEVAPRANRLRPRRALRVPLRYR